MPELEKEDFQRVFKSRQEEGGHINRSVFRFFVAERKARGNVIKGVYEILGETGVSFLGYKSERKPISEIQTESEVEE